MRARFIGSLALGAGAVLVAGGSADAASTAKVRFVDNYHHGRVKVTLDDVTRKLSYGDVTKDGGYNCTAKVPGPGYRVVKLD